jgi:hypothetical protein
MEGMNSVTSARGLSYRIFVMEEEEELPLIQKCLK